IPVVTPSAASIDTVKLVRCSRSVSLTISGSRSCAQRSRVSVRQISPRPKRAMKLMSAAETPCAAITRSPSFSRSSSSMITTMRPARRSASISSVLFNSMKFPSSFKFQESFGVTRHEVNLEIDLCTELQFRQGRGCERKRHQVDTKVRACDLIDGQAYPIERHRSLAGYVTLQVLRCAKPQSL